MFRFDRFEELRKERGITKTYIARQLGRGASLCQSWKDKKATPSPEQLQFLADLFGVTPEYLMGESDDKHPPAKPVYVRPALEEGKTLMAVRRIISDLSEEDLQKVAEYVEFLKSRGEK